MGVSLRRAGHEVTVATGVGFEGLVTAHGLAQRMNRLRNRLDVCKICCASPPELTQADFDSLLRIEARSAAGLGSRKCQKVFGSKEFCLVMKKAHPVSEVGF